MTDTKSEIIKLAEERRRSGKPAFTIEELLKRQQAIRDGSLVWLEQCVLYAKSEGIKEAQALYDHASRTIENLERSMRTKR